MKKLILTALLLGLTACGTGSNGRTIGTFTYTLTSSTCNMPPTVLKFDDPSFFVDGLTKLEVTQSYAFLNCEHKMLGQASINNGVFTTNQLTEVSTKPCAADFVWQEVYTMSESQNTMTLVSNQCTATFTKE